jgi:hypothetical protein
MDRYSNHMAWKFITLIALFIVAVMSLYQAVLRSNPIPGVFSIFLFVVIYFLSGTLKEISLGENGITILETIRRKKIEIPYSEIDLVNVYRQKRLYTPASILQIYKKNNPKPFSISFSIWEEATCSVVAREIEGKLGKNAVRSKSKQPH